MFLCAHSSCDTGRPGNHVPKSGQRKCCTLQGRAAVLLRAGDESAVNDKGGQPRIKSGQRKRCTLQVTQARVCCCLLGHGLCNLFSPKNILPAITHAWTNCMRLCAWRKHLFWGQAPCKTNFFAKLISQAPEQAPHQHPMFEGPTWQNAWFCGGCLGSCTLERKQEILFSF